MEARLQRPLRLHCCLRNNHRRTKKNPEKNDAANTSLESPSLCCCWLSHTQTHTHQLWRPTPVLHRQHWQHRTPCIRNNMISSSASVGRLPPDGPMWHREAQDSHPSLWHLQPVITHQSHHDPRCTSFCLVFFFLSPRRPLTCVRQRDRWLPSAVLAAAETRRHHRQRWNMMNENVPFSVSAH